MTDQQKPFSQLETRRDVLSQAPIKQKRSYDTQKLEF